MPTISNKTRKPLSIPLPGGKKLHLGPGKEAQIIPKAVDFPPVQKLVESGDVEITGQDKKTPHGSGGGGDKGPSQSSRPNASGSVRHTGDR